MARRLKLDYPFTIRPLSADEGGGYFIEFPDLPGCVSDGESPEEALRNGQDALRAYLEDLRASGEPAPRSSAAASGQWRQRVPRSLHSRLSERARQEGVSLNTLVTAYIAEGLGRAARKRQSKA